MRLDRIDRIRNDLNSLIEDSAELDKLRLLLDPHHKQKYLADFVTNRDETDEEVIARLAAKP